jgi:formate-dependent nitrite reductase membrane component NrfD
MAHLVWWYTLGVVTACILIGLLLNYSTDHMSENIHKLITILSIFAVIGLCGNPIESR